MITWKYLDQTQERVFKMVDGANVGGGLVTDAEFQQWLAEGNNPDPADTPTHNDIIKAQIAALEKTVTDRMLREAALGIDRGRLLAINDQIEALRAQMEKG
jgi:hypothetical protein